MLTSGGAVNTQCARVAETLSSSPTLYIGQFRQADATNRRFGVAQIIQQDDCIDLRGKSVTFSFYARTDGTEITALRAGIVEWTGTGDSVTSDIVSSWAATPTLIANAAFANTPSDLTVTSSMAQFTITATLGTSFNNLIVFVWTPNEEAQNDDFYLMQTQLVKGSSPVEWPLIAKSYSQDLAECSAFYQKSYNVDVAPETATAVGNTTARAHGTNHIFDIRFHVQMRATPTVISYNPSTGTLNQARDISASTNKTASISDAGQSGFSNYITSSVDGNGTSFQWTAESEL
jgi:hypothetical protein